LRVVVANPTFICTASKMGGSTLSSVPGGDEARLVVFGLTHWEEH